MLALSIRQPYAWLILHGGKDIENRTWPTARRGPCLIHAGLQWFVHPREWPSEFDGLDLPPPAEIPRGGIVGRVDIMDCVTRYKSQWFEGPYGLVMRNRQPLPFVPFPGRLGFFDVPDSLLLR